MEGETRLDAAAVAALARAADLPLEEGRSELLAGQLSEWLTAANELNRKLARNRDAVPATVFVHPLPEGGDQ